VKDAIYDLLSSRGVLLHGVSAPRQIDEMPLQFTPTHILSDTRSVFCYAVPIPKGILQAKDHSSLLFWRFSNMTYRFLDMVSNEICTELEAQGHIAVPIYSCFPWKTHANRFHGLLSLPHWAQECGIGKITKCGLAGNVRVGTRILLGGVITSADLKKTGDDSAHPCPPDCFLCQESCPANAIAKSGRVDHNLCVRQSGVNPLLAHLLADKGTKTRFEFDTLLNSISVDDHGMYTCSKCLEVCPLNR